MKKVLKKMIAMGLSTCMTLSFASAALADDGAESPIDTSPVTFTIGIDINSSQISDGIHTEDNPVLKQIEEKTGVTLDFVRYDNEKFGVLAASGDLPEIVSTREPSIVMTLIQNGSFLPLNDLLDEYGGNIQKNIPDALEMIKVLTGQEEDIYLIPSNVSHITDVPLSNGYIGFRARYDIYKEIGSPEIHNEDEYLEVLKQMQDYQREKTGDNSIYGLSLWADGGLWPFIITYPFSRGQTNGSTANYSVDLETGEYIRNFMDTDSAFWDGIRFYNKAYNMGILDPDGFTQKQEQYSEKVSNGKVLCGTEWTTVNPDICGEDAVSVYLPGSGFEYLSGVYDNPAPCGYQLTCATAISTNCKDPERAMQFINWLNSDEGARILANGVLGEDWDVIDGVPQYIGEMKEALMNGTSGDYKTNKGELSFANSHLYTGYIVSEDGYPAKLTNTEDYLESMTNSQLRSFAEDFGCEYPGQVYRKWVEEGTVKTVQTEKGATVMCLIGAISDESMQISSEASNYLMSHISKLIMAESQEDFDAEQASVIDKFIEIGVDKCDEEISAMFDEALATYAELYGE